MNGCQWSPVLPFAVICVTMVSAGQWSPANPEGKKQYDREFLLKLQAKPESRKPPPELDMPEIMVDVSTFLAQLQFHQSEREAPQILFLSSLSDSVSFFI